MPDPVELMWPLAVDGTGGLAFTSDPAVILHKHISSVIATEHGERVMRQKFGVSPKRFLFEGLDDRKAEELRTVVREAMSVLIPEVTVLSTTSQADESASTFLISVRYRMRNGLEATTSTSVGSTPYRSN